MGEKDTERKSRRFWSLDILWLVPWAAYFWGWAYRIECIRQPVVNPCRPFSQGPTLTVNELILKCALIAAPVCPLLLRWLLMKLRIPVVWRILGVLGAVIACLGLLWSWMPYTDDSETRALGDCRNISTAIMLFHKDTGEWPYYCSPFDDPDRKPCIDYLYGAPGDMPDLYKPVWHTWGTVGDDIFFHIVKNGRERPLYRPKPPTGADPSSSELSGWDGPYLPYFVDDAWGNKYLVSVGAFEGGRLKGSYVWCISAGPNQCLETPTTAAQTQGDDIGYRTK